METHDKETRELKAIASAVRSWIAAERDVQSKRRAWLHVELGHIADSWEARKGFLGWRKEVVVVYAVQVDLDDGGVAKSTTALIEIKRNGRMVYRRNISYPNIRGKVALATQVYTMAESLDYINPEFREIMKKAALRVKGFDPSKFTIFWSGNDASKAR
jgi:hypothetical protein